MLLVPVAVVKNISVAVVRSNTGFVIIYPATYTSRGHDCGFLVTEFLPIATLLKPLRSQLCTSYCDLLSTKISSLYNRIRGRAKYTFSRLRIRSSPDNPPFYSALLLYFHFIVCVRNF